MFENYYAVIMAGGGGTRLWPLSRQSRPKQMLKLGQERSLFQVAVDRLQGLLPPEQILVVTVEDQAPGLQEQCPEIPLDNYLLETMPRGTASVVGYAAAILSKRDPEAVMAVLTADHIIGNLKLFQKILTAAYQVAGENNLVTLGVTPSYPATGYGYTRRGELIGKYKDLDVYQVLEFTEKPVLSEAERMFNSGEYAWNSGMFIWRVDVILNEIARQMPALFSQLSLIKETWGTEEQEKTIREVWPEIKPQTIDFGIMENAEKVAVIPAVDLQWNDVGSWEALFDLLPADEDGNIALGEEHISLDTTGTLIYALDTPRTVVTIGARDLIVVDTGDILLICSRDKAQEVRQVVNNLKKAGRTDLI
ncbi:MAG: sugar phosphate nucleotidyltransferase [Anaerolineales bacterium]|nr:sugar phosphate nucleotidyltransferase [Anaerolineales bacterium]